jgi:hypothetical protein
VGLAAVMAASGGDEGASSAGVTSKRNHCTYRKRVGKGWRETSLRTTTQRMRLTNRIRIISLD